MLSAPTIRAGCRIRGPVAAEVVDLDVSRRHRSQRRSGQRVRCPRRRLPLAASRRGRLSARTAIDARRQSCHCRREAKAETNDPPVPEYTPSFPVQRPARRCEQRFVSLSGRARPVTPGGAAAAAAPVTRRPRPPAAAWSIPGRRHRPTGRVRCSPGVPSGARSRETLPVSGTSTAANGASSGASVANAAGRTPENTTSPSTVASADAASRSMRIDASSPARARVDRRTAVQRIIVVPREAGALDTQAPAAVHAGILADSRRRRRPARRSGSSVAGADRAANADRPAVPRRIPDRRHRSAMRQARQDRGLCRG